MNKVIFIFLATAMINGCGSLQEIANQLPNGGALSQLEIGNGLRQALDQGIDKEVSKLMAVDGFYRNELVKIVLPEELQKVDSGLRRIGLSSVADEGLKLLNRAAEDATKEALPIFIDAVKGISFDDAKNILLGDQRAATSYLENRTQVALYAKFSPVIQNSLGKVGAADLWGSAITRYNSIPFTKEVNPDLTDYVTQKALQGIFTMISVEEIQIREKVSARRTDLLRKVFALQDK